MTYDPSGKPFPGSQPAGYNTSFQLITPALSERPATLSHVTQLVTDLTPEEVRALHNYKAAAEAPCGRSHCFDLNSDLDRGLWPDELTRDLKETVTHLDAVLARSPPLPCATTVFRGDGHRLRFRDIGIVGTTFRNLGFWSTATNRRSAHSFLRPASQNGFGVVFELHLPVGLQVYDMESLEGAGGAETELLLPRGVLWTVEEVKGLASDVDRLTASRFPNIFDLVLAGALPPRPLICQAPRAERQPPHIFQQLLPPNSTGRALHVSGILNPG